MERGYLRFLVGLVQLRRLMTHETIYDAAKRLQDRVIQLEAGVFQLEGLRQQALAENGRLNGEREKLRGFVEQLEHRIKELEAESKRWKEVAEMKHEACRAACEAREGMLGRLKELEMENNRLNNRVACLVTENNQLKAGIFPRLEKLEERAKAAEGATAPGVTRIVEAVVKERVRRPAFLEDVYYFNVKRAGGEWSEWQIRIDICGGAVTGAPELLYFLMARDPAYFKRLQTSYDVPSREA